MLGSLVMAGCGGGSDEESPPEAGPQASNSSDTLGTATLFATGDADASLGELAPGESTLDQAPVGRAALVTAGSADRFYLYFHQFDVLADVTADGRIEQLGYASTGSAVQGPTVVGFSTSGAMAVAQAPSGDEPGSRVLLRNFNAPFDGQVPTAFPVGAVALADDRSLVVGSADEARIDLVGPDGTAVGLLGPAGSDARVVTDEPLGPVVAALRLADNRVVFVADTTDGRQLYVLDDTTVRPVEAELRGDQVNPVAFEGDDPLATASIAPAPDGRLLTVGLVRDDTLAIALLDVDEGTVEVLTELEGIEPSAERPISAAAVGDDVVFLADGRLWRIAGAL